jgi:hypothetical protein
VELAPPAALEPPDSPDSLVHLEQPVPREVWETKGPLEVPEDLARLEFKDPKVLMGRWVLKVVQVPRVARVLLEQLDLPVPLDRQVQRDRV